jgi:hypothetical protein
VKWSIAVGAVVALTGRDAEKTARLRFEERHVEGGPVYIEGAYQYVELRPTGADDPDLVIRLARGRAERSVAPDRYTVVSYTRACSAVCPNMSPVRDGHCQRRVTIGEHEAAALTIRTRFGERCAIARASG